MGGRKARGEEEVAVIKTRAESLEESLSCMDRKKRSALRNGMEKAAASSGHSLDVWEELKVTPECQEDDSAFKSDRDSDKWRWFGREEDFSFGLSKLK